MDVEYQAVLPRDQDNSQGNVAHSVVNEYEYLTVLPSEQELPQSNMQCTIADGVEREYLAVLPSDQGDLYSNATYRVDTESEYLVVLPDDQGDFHITATQPTAAANSHSKHDRNTDTNSHINGNTCSPTYDSHIIVNAGLPTYGMSETREQADVSVLHNMINTEHHPDTDTNYSQLEDFSSDLNDTNSYYEELSIPNTMFPSNSRLL